MNPYLVKLTKYTASEIIRAYVHTTTNLTYNEVHNSHNIITRSKVIHGCQESHLDKNVKELHIMTSKLSAILYNTYL